MPSTNVECLIAIFKEARYKVVVLPNVRCLSERELSLLTEYVENGGNIVAKLMKPVCVRLNANDFIFSLVNITSSPSGHFEVCCQFMILV